MTGQAVIGAVVEGHGEVQAVPELLRRIAREVFGQEVRCLVPHRIPRSKITDEQELGRALRLQASRVGGHGGVLVLLDADDDDPESLQHTVQAIADSAAPAITASVVAVREFEAWFLAGVESLRSHRSIRDDAAYHGDPEGPRDAKGALSHLMTEPYAVVRHQVAFCALVSLDTAARRSPSFSTLVAAVERLIGQER